MKRVYLYIAALVALCSAQPAMGQQILGGKANVKNVKIGKVADKMFVSMDIEPDGKWNVKSNQSIVLTPSIASGDNVVMLPKVLILGRNQYLYHQRNASAAADMQNMYKAKKTGMVHYETSVSYAEWMCVSDLVLNDDLCGCCKTLLASNHNQIEQYNAGVFNPVFAYVVPKAEAVKMRAESGQAYVTFHVSKTNIDERYLNNTQELQKIVDAIELVRKDKDVTITGLRLKGHASPEGSYESNVRLAKGRTEAVAAYVRKLSGDNSLKITTTYEAEDWAGLRKYIEESGMRERKALLDIIDSPALDSNPDAREWRIKNTYPEAYRHLLNECYPMLRRTDFWVEFNVRSFNLEESKAQMKTSPHKLSLQEMYNVAQTYEPGSDAYNEVFDTAVRMFPDDATANLNAANSALQRGDTTLAEKYLAKAGNTTEAYVARGILAKLKGDPNTAVSLLRKAKEMGAKAAEPNLKQIENNLK